MPVNHEVFSGTERFEIRRKLGGGAFGVVYEAYDRERESVVALKVLRQAESSPLYLFKQEFRNLTNLVHPNLVTLYELQADGEQWFFTMEMVEGMDFQKFVVGSPSGPDADTTTILVAPTAGKSAADLPTVPLPKAYSMFPQDELSEQPTSDIQMFIRSSGSSSTDSSEDPTVDPATFERSLGSDGKSGFFPSVSVNLNHSFDETRLRDSLRQLTAGVKALHDLGKLHRDLKPSNVLVTHDGRVVILDFGLVAELKEHAETGGQEIVGTPAYMSPEQATGEELTPASDMYSIGVMLYEALTGHVVFRGDLYSIIRQKHLGDFTPPKRLAPQIPDDLNDLCCNLLQRNPAQRLTAMQVLEQLTLSDGSQRSRSRAEAEHAIPLVGRSRQLKDLLESYEAAQNQPGIALVHGNSGMGKSVLVDCFLSEIKSRTPQPMVLSGRCYEQESVPYKAFDSIVDVLSRRLKTMLAKEVPLNLPPDLPYLAKLFPVLQQVAMTVAGDTPLELPDSQELRRRAFGALRQLLTELATHAPLVIHIDDLQWGDVDSAALLMEISRPPDPPPLLLVAGYRTDEAATSQFLTIFLAKLQDKTLVAAPVREVQVGELSTEDARKLVFAILGDIPGTAERAEAIVREAAGSPFFLNELARHAQTHDMSTGGGARETLDAIIRERVAELPETARRLLEIAAVAGQPVGRLVVKRAAEIGSDEQAAVTLLRSQHLIRVRRSNQTEEVEPYHDRIREAVENGLAPERLEHHHLRLAVELEAYGGTDPETLAIHYRDGRHPVKAFEYALIAADQSVEATAFDRAVRLYRMALELSPAGTDRRPLLVKLGEAQANAGRGAESAETYLKAAALPESAETKATALELRRRAAEQYLTSGHIDEGLRLTDQVLHSVGLRLAPTPTRAMISLLLRRLWIRLRGLGFVERKESEVPPEKLVRLDICWSVAAGLVFVDNIRSAEFQTRYLLAALKLGEPFRISRGVNLFAGGSSVTGGRSLARTKKLLEASEAMAQHVNHPYSLGMVKVTAGLIAFYNGRWRESISLFDAGEDILRPKCRGVTWELNTSRYYALRAMFFLGDLRQMTRDAATLIQDARERGDVHALAGLRLRSSYVTYLAADNMEQARQETEDGIRQWTSHGHHIQHFFYLAAQIEIELYAGNGQRAWEQLSVRWKEFSKSLLFRVQTLLIEFHYLHARSGLSAWATETDPAKKHLYVKEAERDAIRIEKERMEWCRGIPEVIRAGIALTQGQPSRAIELLEAAEIHFQAADMKLHATAAQYRRGQLLGGSAGQVLLERAQDWMQRQEIENPKRMVDMLVPMAV
ncbi:MAG: protein kinase [Blastocatellia bacterium]|nr:protein kinase [Blastocatellia bacterium]